jgi:hypothetical protein
LNVTFRNVDEGAFRKLKAAAAETGLTMGEAASDAFRKWAGELSKFGTKKRLSVLDFKPVRIGSKTLDLTREIDEIVYGGMK